MIRFLSSLVIIISLFCAADASAKVGVVPLQQLTVQSNMGIEKERVLLELFGSESKALEEEFAAFNRDAESFSKQAQALSEQARVEKAQTLETTMRNLEAKRNNFMRSIAPVEQKINTQILAILDEAFSNYAKDNGYSVIIDAAAVTYANSEANLYDGILNEVNAVWKSKGSKFNLD